VTLSRAGFKAHCKINENRELKKMAKTQTTTNAERECVTQLLCVTLSRAGFKAHC
jgi:hypothetical protein